MRLKYKLLQFIRDKEVMFYSLMLPIIMGLLFYAAIDFVDEETGLIPVAIVQENSTTAINQSFLELAKYLEQQERLILNFESLETAEGMLQAGQVSGVIILGDTMELMLANAGVEQNIIEGIVNEFTIRAAAIESISELRPEYIGQALIAMETFTTVNRSVLDIPVNAAANFFYLILAMGCFNASIKGLKMGFELQAHVSDTAARLSVAPTKKLVLILENLAAAVIMQTLASAATILFYVFVLGIDFGTQWGLILLACVVGSFASVAFGLFFSVVAPGKIETKGGYLAIITYGFMFAGGIFGGVQIRDIVRTSLPLLDRINIMAIISDTFLSLVLHEDLNRFMHQLTILIGIGLVCSVAGAIVLRRKSYANL